MLRQTLAAVTGAIAFAVTLSAPAYAAVPLKADTAVSLQERTQDTQRTTRGERRRAERARQQGPDAAEVMAGAQAAVAAANSTCQVAEAKLLGQNEEEQNLYEVDCASGPGYLVQASTPPQMYDCMVLANTAAKAAETGEEPGPTCTIPANADTLGIIAGMAAEAGITCTVDEAALLGQTNDEAAYLIYEVGCKDVDGFWLTRTATGWDTTSCVQVVAQNGTCRFSPVGDQAAVANGWLANTDISDCNVQQVRLMGQNANGQFYEVKCEAPDTGYIIRMNDKNEFQQSYACAVAQRVGGGCTLTQVAPPAEQ